MKRGKKNGGEAPGGGGKGASAGRAGQGGAPAARHFMDNGDGRKRARGGDEHSSGYSDSDEAVETITINKGFEKRLQAKAERDAIRKLKEMEADEVSDSESDESEDEVGEQLTPAMDLTIMRTINMIRKRDPSIYSADTKPFSKLEGGGSGRADNSDDSSGEEEDDEHDGDDASDKKKRKKNKKMKKAKPVKYKDLLRQQIMDADSAEDAISSSDSEGGEGGAPRSGYGKRVTGEGARGAHALAYDEEQQTLRQSFLKGLASEKDEDSDVAVGGEGGGKEGNRKKKKEAAGRKDAGRGRSDGDEEEEEGDFLKIRVKSAADTADDESAFRKEVEELQRIQEAERERQAGGAGGVAKDTFSSSFSATGSSALVGAVKKGGRTKLWAPEDGEEEGEKFLTDFIVNRRWKDGQSGDGEGGGKALPTYEELVQDSEDEDEVERQEEFERRFNFRFEEEGGDQIQGYSREVRGSMRRPDDKRKRQREERKQQKAIKRKQKEDELRRLKNVKKREIMAKLAKIEKMSGGATLDEATLEEDFDPDRWDAKMKEAFDDEYYQHGEHDAAALAGLGGEKGEGGAGDESAGDGDGDDGGGDDGGWRPGDDPLAGLGDMTMYDEDGEEEEEEEGEEGEEGGGGSGWSGGGRQEEEDEEGLGAEGGGPGPGEGPIVRSKLMDELYKLDYEDLIGDMPTRFKYRQVKPSSFGLSAEELLLADDKQLNKLVSLKKLAPYSEVEPTVDAKKRQRFRMHFKEVQKEVEQQQEEEARKRRKSRRGVRKDRATAAAAAAAATEGMEKEGGAFAKSRGREDEGKEEEEEEEEVENPSQETEQEEPVGGRRKRRKKAGKKVKKGQAAEASGIANETEAAQVPRVKPLSSSGPAAKPFSSTGAEQQQSEGSGGVGGASRPKQEQEQQQEQLQQQLQQQQQQKDKKQKRKRSSDEGRGDRKAPEGRAGGGAKRGQQREEGETGSGARKKRKGRKSGVAAAAAAEREAKAPKGVAVSRLASYGI